MKATLLGAAVLVVSSAAQAGSEADWSIGAGVGYGFSTSLSLGSSASGLSTFPVSSLEGTQTLTPNASVEHRLGEGTWLLLGISGDIARSTAPLPKTTSAYSSYTTAQTSGGGALALGLRRYVTGPDAIVGVSFHAAIDAGVEATSIDYTTLDATSVAIASHASATAWNVGAFGGLALDKNLTERLSLRLSMALVSIDYTKTTSSPSGLGVESSSFGASLMFDPDLELRLAF